MSETKCLILGPEFVYAVISGNVEIESDKELPLANWGKKGTVFQCADGNLEGFNVKLGEFVAPKDGFYTISFFCRYNISNSSPVTGMSYTKMTTFKEYKTQSISPLGTTNPFTRWKKSYISASSLSGSIPLVKGEKIFFSLYQKNSVVKKAKVEAELIIKYESSYKNAIDTNIFAEKIRCGKVEEAKGNFELRTRDKKYVQYVLRNPMNPFDKLEAIQEDGTVTTLYPLDFNKFSTIYARKEGITTNSQKLLDEAELFDFSVNPEIGIARLNLYYDGNKELTLENVVIDDSEDNKELISKLRKEVERRFIEFIIKRDMKSVSEYIDDGLNINFIGPDDKTPLEYAIENEDLNMVKYLVRKGAEIDGVTLDTAIMVPDSEESSEIYNYIYKRMPSTLDTLKDVFSAFDKRLDTGIREMMGYES